LVKCGALDGFGYDRGMLLSNIETILAFARHSQEESSSKHLTLFSGTSIDIAHKLKLQHAPPSTEQEKMMWEKELLGLYVTSHPFAEFQKLLSRQLTMVKDVSGQPRNKWIVVGGVIDSTKKKITRSGKPMMFVTIADTTGSLEILVFPKVYEPTKDVWVEGSMACVIGKTSEDEGDDKMFVEKAYTLTKENIHSIAAQLVGYGGSGGGERSARAVEWQVPAAEIVPPAQEPILIEEFADRIEIALPLAVMQKKTEQLKSFFHQFVGEKLVYLKSGTSKIKTPFKVIGGKDFEQAVRAVLEG
jgi:DNA polymerase-3 subunit alpha